MSGIFVTGTDTSCGKTEVSLGLMFALQRQGLCVLGMKPVASGCEGTTSGLRNEDARRLLDQGSTRVVYDQVNPYALAPPIAPHIAAGQAGVTIELERICTVYQQLAAQGDWVVVEGVGGWRVPLGPSLSVSDLPLSLGLPVVLVVGLRLGCLNHALLTAESIRARGSRLAGWVANQIDPQMLVRQENLATLAALIDAPCLGLVPSLMPLDPRRVADCLSIEPLLSETPAGS